MAWKLKQAEEVDCTIDDSGLYVIINRVIEKQMHKEYAGEIILVRVDLMSDKHEPIMSWIGQANNVRKHLIQYIREYFGFAAISSEHASYIGWELHRAETDPNFVQD